MPYIGNITSDFSIDTGNITNRAVTATKLSPSSVGSNGQVLSIDGSGNLQWGNDANAPEGTAVLSTGESGTTKYLRVDGDGTCSWQLAVDATKTTLTGSTNNTICTVTGANAIQGEASLTYNGQDTLSLDHSATNENSYLKIAADDNRRKTLVFDSGGTTRGVIGIGDSDEAVATTLFISANNNVAGTTPHLVILSDGKVGIGTTSPGTNLHVKGTGTDVLKIESTDAGAQGTNLILQHSPGSGNMADDDVISLIQFNGVDNSNTGCTYASIRTVATAVANNSEKGDLTFWTRNGSNFLEKLRIDSYGNVGQGVTPKTWNLGKAINVGYLENVLHGESGNGFHMVQNAYYNGGWKKVSADLSSIYTQWQGTHIFYTNATGSADDAITWQSRLKILSTGEVGLGTDTPGWNLDVHGSNTTIGIEGTGWAQLRLTGGGSENYITSDDHLSFYVGGTEKVFFNTDGAIGVGTDNPRGSSTYVGLELNGTIGGVITFSDDDVEKWNVYGQNDVFGIYDRVNTRYNFKCHSDGDVELPSGNLKVANGKGIDFSAQTGTSATGAATGNSPAEVLAHYEEGTWTPVPNFGTSGSVTAVASGHYTRVGRVVNICWTFYTTALNSPSGNFTLTGLPFDCLDHSSSRFGVSFSFKREWDTDMPNINGLISGGNTIYFYKHATNSGSSVQVQGSDFATGSADNYLYGSATYMAA